MRDRYDSIKRFAARKTNQPSRLKRREWTEWDGGSAREREREREKEREREREREREKERDDRDLREQG
jgi:RNA-binding protein 25